MISVIIPIFNMENWLACCLSSVLTSVSHHPDCEIILVNDGSTDRSGAICDEFAAIHSLIHVIHKPNGGVASARNAGLAHARGDYICWVDPDDHVSPDWFSDILNAITREKPDVIVFDTIRFDESSEFPEVYGRSPGPVDRDLFIGDVMRDIRMLSGLSNKVFRTSLFSGVRFDPSLPILEDFAAMPQILNHARSVFYIPKCLYYYRQHGSSLLHHVTPARAFLSFETALQRANAVQPQYRRAAETAAAIQAYSYCRNQKLYNDFKAEKDQLRDCRNYVRKKLLRICADPEVPVKWKLKFFLLALNFS